MEYSWKHFYIFTIFFLWNIIISQCAIVFRRSPADTIVTQGSATSLHCTAENTDTSGAIQIGWKFNGNYIVAGDHYLLFQNGTLYISQTRLGDQGEYVCVASVIGRDVMAETQAARIYFAFIDPVFYHPNALTVEDGQPYAAYFQCVSGDSQPSASITWEKDGVAFMAGTSYQTEFGGPGSLKISGTLQIDDISEEDEGQYRCVTVNPMLPGQPMRSNYATLTVSPRHGRPYIKGTPVNMTVGIGNSATIECPIVGTPTPTITWTKLGEIGPIRNTLTRYVLNTGGLYFTAVSLSDEGAYVCTGSNTEGTISTNPIFLKAATMDSSFVQEPSDVFAVLGNAVTLTCRPPFSIPPATVLWYKNNVQIIVDASNEITQLDNGDLHIRAVSLANGGQYFCAATNSYIPRTLTSRTATLSIQVGALITDPPDNTKVILHDTAVLRCIANGDPKPTITWYKDQNVIDSNYYDLRYTVGLDGSTVTISDVIYVDQGTYICEARNYGNIDRASAFLDVIVPPEIVREPPDDLAARVTSTVLVNCEVIGDPTPIITWYKDGNQLTDGTGHFIITSQGLQIVDVAMDDAGVYRCKAENEAGVDEATGVLKVEDLPLIVQGPLNQTVNEGSTVIMTCQAAAFPEPTYSWQYNGGLLPSQAEVSDDGRTLRIAVAMDTNSGMYTCRVANLHGMDEASAELFVRVSPSAEPISDMTVDEGSGITVVCLADGKPTPSIQWLKGDYQLTANTRITFPAENILQINPVVSSDEGIYYCLAHNPAGSVRISFQVTVAESGMTTSMTEIPPSTGVTAPSVSTPIPPTATAPPPVNQSTSSPRVTDHPSTAMMTSSQSAMTSQTTTVTGTHNTTVTPDSPGHTTSLKEISTLLSVSTQKLTTVEPVLEAAPIVISVEATSSSQVIISWIPSSSMQTILYYVIQFKLRFATEWQTYSDTVGYQGGTQTYQVSGLQSNTQYLFRVLATNQYGLGEPSNALSATTLTDRKGPSVPRNMQIISVNSTSVQLQWEIPEDRDGEIASYQIEYMQVGKTGTILELESSGLFVSTAVISDLLPLTTYEFRVRASIVIEGVTEWGNYTEYVQTQTLHGAPSNAPFGVFARSQSSTSIYVSWQPVEIGDSGVITKYDIQCVETSTDEVIAVVEVPGHTPQAAVSSLKPWRWYSVRVRAHNTQGAGMYSESVQTRTMAAAPSAAPENLMAVPITGEAEKLNITWEEVAPGDQNGVIDGYFLQYWPSDQSSTAKSITIPGGGVFEFILTGLNAYTEYTLRILAYITLDGQKSGGPFSESVSAQTDEGLPGRIENLEITAGDDYLYVTWQQPSEEARNGIVTGYAVKYYVTSLTEGETDPSSVDNLPVGFLNSTHGYLMTSISEYNLTDLVTNTMYAVSVTARTKTGVGYHPVALTKSTGSVTPSILGEISTPVMDTTHMNVQTPGPTDTSAESSTPNAVPRKSTSGITTEWWTIPPKDMPVFIGAMVAIGLSILGILIFGICYCRYRNKKAKKRQSYLIPPSANKSRTSRSQSMQGVENLGNVELEETSTRHSKRTQSISESVAEREKGDGVSSPRSEVAVTATIENDAVATMSGSAEAMAASNHSVPMQVTRMEEGKQKSKANKEKSRGMMNSNSNNMNREEMHSGKSVGSKTPMNDFGYSTLDELKYLPADEDRNIASYMDLDTLSNSNNVTPRDIPSPALSSGTGLNVSSLSSTELDAMYSKVNFKMKKRNLRKRDSAADIAAVLSREDELGRFEFHDYDTPMSVILLSKEKTSL